LRASALTTGRGVKFRRQISVSGSPAASPALVWPDPVPNPAPIPGSHGLERERHRPRRETRYGWEQVDQP
jgi:hypothetical protein